MTVDIRGANTHNKGAELMLRAVADRLSPRFDLSAVPFGTEFRVRAGLGLRQTLHVHQSPVLATQAGRLVPGRVRDWYGLVNDDDITGVVDVSGFAYSDSFPPVRSRREAIRARRWSKRGVKLVFLPQAFGPFENAEQRKWSRELLLHADLLFCRDRVSLGHVRELVPEANPVLSPDFTIGLHAQSWAGPSGFLALVPNTKLVDKGVLSEEDYLEQLRRAGEAGRANGIEPLVVLHEVHDVPLGRRLAGVLECDVFADADPLRLKGALGSASAVVGSRFHAVVGALSQGVPVLVLGWSHKYAELLNDFGVPQWGVPADADMGEALIEMLDDETGKRALREARARLLAQVDDMWDRTIEVLGSAPHR